MNQTVTQALPPLAEAQRQVMLLALDDAIAARRERASVHCDDCSIHPAGLCEDHAADLDRASEYEDLARQLEAAQ